MYNLRMISLSRNLLHSSIRFLRSVEMTTDYQYLYISNLFSLFHPFQYLFFRQSLYRISISSGHAFCCEK